MTARRPFGALLLYTVLLLAAVLAPALAPPAGAVTLDEAARALQRGRRVYDFAGVLSPAEVRQLNDRLSALENEGLAEGVLVLADRLEGSTIQELAMGLGERWKVGRRDTDNGLVIAASIADRKAWIEVGRDLQGAVSDAEAARAVKDGMAPEFRQGRYGAGLLAAVGALETELREAGGVEALPRRTPEPARQGPPGEFVLLTLGLTAGAALIGARSWPRGALPGQDGTRLPVILLGLGALACAVFGASQAPSGGLGLILVGLVPGAFALARLLEGAWVPVPLERAEAFSSASGPLYWIAAGAGAVATAVVAGFGWMLLFLLAAVVMNGAVRGYLRRVSRRCPECAGALRWLPEAEEPAHLREDENLEQSLGSVDYDIWRCGKCDRSAVFTRAQLMSPYTECPRCRRRTLTRRAVVDEQPTVFADGWSSEITECKNPGCGYEDRKRRRMPRGGGWDFGGPGIIILPPMGGGGWGGGGWGGGGGDSGGGWGGGIDAGDFGGGGGFDGGGGGGDW